MAPDLLVRLETSQSWGTLMVREVRVLNPLMGLVIRFLVAYYFLVILTWIVENRKHRVSGVFVMGVVWGGGH